MREAEKVIEREEMREAERNKEKQIEKVKQSEEKRAAEAVLAKKSDILDSTVGQNNQEYRLEYWVTRSSIRLFARTAYLFACSAILTLLTCFAALTCSLSRSLRSLPCSWESE